MQAQNSYEFLLFNELGVTSMLGTERKITGAVMNSDNSTLMRFVFLDTSNIPYSFMTLSTYADNTFDGRRYYRSTKMNNASISVHFPAINLDPSQKFISVVVASGGAWVGVSLICAHQTRTCSGVSASGNAATPRLLRLQMSKRHIGRR